MSAWGVTPPRGCHRCSSLCSRHTIPFLDADGQFGAGLYLCPVSLLCPCCAVLGWEAVPGVGRCPWRCHWRCQCPRSPRGCCRGVCQNQPVLFSVPIGLGGIANMPSLTTVAPVPMASIPVVGMSPPLVSSVPAAVPPLANGAPAVIQPLPAFAHPGTPLSLSVSCS